MGVIFQCRTTKHVENKDWRLAFTEIVFINVNNPFIGIQNYKKNEYPTFRLVSFC